MFLRQLPSLFNIGKGWPLLSFWLAGAAGFLGLAYRHDIEPSREVVEGQFLSKHASSITQEVVDSLKLDPNPLSVVMFIHPECPCTPASLSALDKLVAESGQAFDLQILVSSYENFEDLESTNAKLASQIRGASLRVDHGGALAKSLHAEASGTICIFGPNYKLLYLGGITNGRGCNAIGPNFAMVMQVIQTRVSAGITAPVFGCDL